MLSGIYPEAGHAQPAEVAQVARDLALDPGRLRLEVWQPRVASSTAQIAVDEVVRVEALAAGDQAVGARVADAAWVLAAVVVEVLAMIQPYGLGAGRPGLTSRVDARNDCWVVGNQGTVLAARKVAALSMQAARQSSGPGRTLHHPAAEGRSGAATRGHAAGAPGAAANRHKALRRALHSAHWVGRRQGTASITCMCSPG